MKERYRISPEGQKDRPSEKEIAGLRDPERLLFNYQRAVRRPKVPLYRDPKAFAMLLFILLLTWLITEVVGEKEPPTGPTIDQPVP